MKNNKALIIIGIVLLNVLVVYMIGQSFLGKTGKYDEALAEARVLAEKELCSKSVTKYNEAIAMKDTLSLRIEMLNVYEKGISIGEFGDTYDFFTMLTSTVDKYSDDESSYEYACETLLKYNEIEKCANVLMRSRDFKITSEKLDEYREKIRYRYTKSYTMYTDVLPAFNGVYTVKSDNGYAYLNGDGSPALGGYISASSFSENYAVVKCPHPDGNDRTVIINKSGERQVYLNGVESSSGVAKVKNANGDEEYLLSCKVGERYKYLDINGNEVFGNYAFAGRFRNNVAAVMESECEWKLIDGSGKTIIDTVFSDIVLNEFDECAARGFIFAKTGDKYHIYNLKGEQVGDFSCDDAKPFADDYAAFKIGERWGFVGTDGKVIIAPQYEDAKSFSNGIGAVKINELWAFINSEAKVVIDETFEDVDYLNDNGICFVKNNGYWSYLKMYYTEK